MSPEARRALDDAEAARKALARQRELIASTGKALAARAAASEDIYGVKLGNGVAARVDAVLAAGRRGES